MVTPEQLSRRFLAPGDKLGKYEVIRQIAVGGMAELYLARTVGIEGFEKLVCVKRILPLLNDNPRFVTMFLNEARLAATLHHPNIAQIYDIGQEDGEYFFSMEYVHGEDLGRLADTAREKGVPISLDCVLTLAAGLCAGLHHAHEKASPEGRLLGVVHRDVSPANVLVSYDGAVKLVDFGIAIARAGREPSSLSGLKGKIAYMSPEQCRGTAALDRRSDVFSVGTILYELTTGRLPFMAETEYGVLEQIVDRDAPRPSMFVQGYSPALEAIVMRALARDPARRYATALELQNQLEDYAHDNRLRVSPLVLARLMSTLFPTRLEEWDHARSQGAFFVEQHVVRTLIESGKTADRSPHYTPEPYQLDDETSGSLTAPVQLPNTPALDSEPTELGPEPQPPSPSPPPQQPARIPSPPPGSLHARLGVAAASLPGVGMAPSGSQGRIPSPPPGSLHARMGGAPPSLPGVSPAPAMTPGLAHARVPTSSSGPAPSRVPTIPPGPAQVRVPTIPPGPAPISPTPTGPSPMGLPPMGTSPMGPPPMTPPPVEQPQLLPAMGAPALAPTGMQPAMAAPALAATGVQPAMAPTSVQPAMAAVLPSPPPGALAHPPAGRAPGRQGPVANMPGAVPIMPVPSGGTLVSSATQAGAQPPAVAAGPMRHSSPSPPPYAGSAYDPFGPSTPPRGYGVGPAAAQGAHGAHPGPQAHRATSSVDEITEHVARVPARPTLVIRRKSRLPLAALVVVGAAGAATGVWFAVRGDAGELPSISGSPGATPAAVQVPGPSPSEARRATKVAPDPAEAKAGAEVKGGAETGGSTGEVGRPETAPAGAGQRNDGPVGRAGASEPAGSGASQVVTPPTGSSQATGVSEPASEETEGAGGAPDGSLDPTQRRGGKAAQEARVKAAKAKARPEVRRTDSKRNDSKRGQKPESKEPSWNGDSPFLPESTPRR